MGISVQMKRLFAYLSENFLVTPLLSQTISPICDDASAILHVNSEGFWENFSVSSFSSAFYLRRWFFLQIYIGPFKSTMLICSESAVA